MERGIVLEKPFFGVRGRENSHKSLHLNEGATCEVSKEVEAGRGLASNTKSNEKLDKSKEMDIVIWPPSSSKK